MNSSNGSRKSPQNQAPTDDMGVFLHSAQRVMKLRSVYRHDRKTDWRGDNEFEPIPRKEPNEPDGIKRHNVQVYPSKVIYFPNDRLSKRIATLTEDDFLEMSSGGLRNLVELKEHRRFGKIVSPFRIYDEERSSVTLSEPVEQFDFDLLCVAISEYRKGNCYITPGIIYRALTGKVNRGADAEPTKDQLAAIMHSVEKLMFLKLRINMTDYCEKLNRNGGRSFEILSALLPAQRITETTINGKVSTVIKLIAEPPLWQIARVKKQFMSFDAELLDVPNQQNTKMSIELKNYVLRRLVEIKAHKQLAPTLTFADIFDKCSLQRSSKQRKSVARGIISTFLDHLKARNFIRNFELIRREHTFHLVKLSFPR